MKLSDLRSIFIEANIGISVPSADITKFVKTAFSRVANRLRKDGEVDLSNISSREEIFFGVKNISFEKVDGKTTNISITKVDGKETSITMVLVAVNPKGSKDPNGFSLDMHNIFTEEDVRLGLFYNLRLIADEKSKNLISKTDLPDFTHKENAFNALCVVYIPLNTTIDQLEDTKFQSKIIGIMGHEVGHARDTAKRLIHTNPNAFERQRKDAAMKGKYADIPSEVRALIPEIISSIESNRKDVVRYLRNMEKEKPEDIKTIRKDFDKAGHGTFGGIIKFIIENYARTSYERAFWQLSKKNKRYVLKKVAEWLSRLAEKEGIDPTKPTKSIKQESVNSMKKYTGWKIVSSDGKGGAVSIYDKKVPVSIKVGSITSNTHLGTTYQYVNSYFRAAENEEDDQDILLKFEYDASDVITGDPDHHNGEVKVKKAKLLKVIPLPRLFSYGDDGTIERYIEDLQYYSSTQHDMLYIGENYKPNTWVGPVYHGSKHRGLRKLSTKYGGRGVTGAKFDTPVLFFTSDKQNASWYADVKGDADPDEWVYEAKVRFKNPMDLSEEEHKKYKSVNAVVNDAVKKGHDGVIMRDAVDGDISIVSDVYVVFSDDQVKFIGPIKKPEDRIDGIDHELNEYDVLPYGDGDQWYYTIDSEDGDNFDEAGPFDTEEEAEAAGVERIQKHNASFGRINEANVGIVVPYRDINIMARRAALALRRMSDKFDDGDIKLEDATTGNVYWHGAIETETADGSPSRVLVIITGKNSRKSNSIVVEGGKAPASKRAQKLLGYKEPFDSDVFVYLNDSTPMKSFKNEESVYKEIYSMLSHEIAHALDTGVSKSMMKGKVVGSQAKHKGNYEKYINSKEEVKANISQIISELEKKKALIAKHIPSKSIKDNSKIVMEVLKFSDRWMEISRYVERLNNDSKEKIMKKVAEWVRRNDFFKKKDLVEAPFNGSLLDFMESDKEEGDDDRYFTSRAKHTNNAYKITDRETGGHAMVHTEDQDFPEEMNQKDRGEIFWVEIPKGKTRKGAGYALTLKGIDLIKKHGSRFVNLSTVSDAGRAIEKKLIANGVIEGPTKTSASKKEYKIS